MKLRIKGNSLRLRISRSELAKLQAGAEIVETIYFGASAEQTISYSLKTSSQPEAVAVRYDGRTIAVTLSKEQAAAWGQEGEVGVYATLAVSPQHSLEVLLEKDFACLDRSDAENQDTFDNPHAGNLC